MRFIALLLTVLALTLPATAETVRLGERWYKIDLPQTPKGAPLILALHGGGGNPLQLAASTGLTAPALAQGYAVIYPAGSGRRSDRLLAWNAGYCCGSAARQGVDDVGFLTAVIADATQRFGLDQSRVYLTGMSNGSMLAELYAAQNPKAVRAVAGVAGTLDVAANPVTGAVPLLILHGTADQHVPYAGGVGESSFSRADYASVDAVAAAFLAPWGGPLRQIHRTIDRKDDGTSVTITDHKVQGRVALRLITVTGGGHHWPGARKVMRESNKTQEIDANTEILRFFALH